MTAVARTLAPPSGRLFPQVGGIVARDGDRYLVIGGDGLRATVEGALCAEVAASLESGAPTALLALNDALLDALAPAAPALAFSIYSAVPDEHDRVTQTPGSHRRTLAAIDRAIERGLPVRAAIIVVDPAVDASRLHALLVEHGVPEISMSATYAVGRGTETAAETVVAPAIPGGPIAGGGHRATGARSAGKLCVTYAGDVVPCIFQRANSLGNVRDGSLADLLSRSPRRSLALAMDPSRRLQCRSCRTTEAGLAILRGAR